MRHVVWEPQKGRTTSYGTPPRLVLVYFGDLPNEGVALRVADLSDEEAGELGPLLKLTASILTVLTTPEQVYVCVWSHGSKEEKHLRWII